MQFYNPNIDKSQYVIATYYMRSRNADLRKTAWDLAIGQSVGNPNVRNQWETEELFEKSSCVIVHDKDELKHLTEGEVKIAFPIINTDWVGDGVSHLLCQLTHKWNFDHFIRSFFEITYSLCNKTVRPYHKKNMI